MDIIESKLFKLFPEVNFGFSTKIGLNRTSPYFYNMSMSVGDNLDNVKENREDFFNKLNIENVILQKQIHSDIINIVNKNSSLNESDAMITDEFNLGIGISAADCVPIFVYDSQNQIIAGVHSGWRGTQKKILKQTIRKLKKEYNSNEKYLFIFIGPCISVENYQVSDEFRDNFDDKLLQIINGRIHLNLRIANYNMLIEENISPSNIEISNLCTYENTNLHSYRRDGAISGRALGVISIKRKINV